MFLEALVRAGVRICIAIIMDKPPQDENSQYETKSPKVEPLSSHFEFEHVINETVSVQAPTKMKELESCNFE